MEPSIVGPLSQAARVFLISSVLWCLQSPGALGVPEHPIVRESGLDKRTKEGEVPTVSQNLPPVLPPAKVVRANLTVCLKGSGTPLDQPHMVDQEDCGQQQGGHMNGPEKYCHLNLNYKTCHLIILPGSRTSPSQTWGWGVGRQTWT